MKNKKIIIGILIVVIILICSLWFFNSKLKTEPECEINSDCAFHYTAYTIENPCASCWLSDENWICMNAEKAAQEIERLESEGKIALCEICPGYEWPGNYSCECIKNKCLKTINNSIK